jgi:hypothetical protein
VTTIPESHAEAEAVAVFEDASGWHEPCLCPVVRPCAAWNGGAYGERGDGCQDAPEILCECRMVVEQIGFASEPHWQMPPGEQAGVMLDDAPEAEATGQPVRVWLAPLWVIHGAAGMAYGHSAQAAPPGILGDVLTKAGVAWLDYPSLDGVAMDGWRPDPRQFRWGLNRPNPFDD